MSHCISKISMFLVAFALLLILPLTVSASQQDVPPRSVSELVEASNQDDVVVFEAVEQDDEETEVVVKESPQEVQKGTLQEDTSRSAILNSVSTLTPVAPSSGDLKVYLENIMGGILEEDMSVYQQVKTCYDYLVANTSYGSHMRYTGTQIGNVTAGDIIRQYGTLEGYGAVVLGSKVGMCNAYASAFILMAREIGLDAYLVKGSTRGAGGGYVPHQWAEINIDGTIYLFDPQLEQNLTAAGLGTYNVFCVTYNQVPGRYVKF